MPWSNTPNGGFTSPDATPWLPMADPADCNVADQAADPDSMLAFTRRVIARRSANEDLAVGAYRSLPSPEGGWVFARGERTVVALNMSDQPLELDGGTTAPSPWPPIGRIEGDRSGRHPRRCRPGAER